MKSQELVMKIQRPGSGLQRNCAFPSHVVSYLTGVTGVIAME